MKRDDRMLALPRLYPTRRHWLLFSPYAKRSRSPFLSLKDFPGHEEVLPLLRENGEIEVEFDVIGREMQIFGAWDERETYRALWFEALKAAVEIREREDPAPALLSSLPA